MLAESHSAIVCRNEWWADGSASESYEAGWAREAIFFLRALDVEGALTEAKAEVQISPDGIRWVAEGSNFPLPATVDEVAFCRVREFGQWLRIVARIPSAGRVKILCTIAVKG